MNGSLDLLAMVSQDIDLKRAASTKGGEYAGPCPFCGGTDRFRVWPDHPSGTARWRCMGYDQGRAGCGKGGDAIAYLVERGDITPAEAGRLRRGGTWDRGSPPVRPTPRRPYQAPPRRRFPPSLQWQQAAREFVARAQERLWDEAGGEALAWLRARCLSDESVRAASLGWNPVSLRQGSRDWGFSDGNPVWLPQGWVIPWEIGGEMWQVSIRRPEGTPKYVMAKGSRHALYNADALRPDKPAFLAEGVFDVLSIAQAAGDFVTPVAAGSTTGARDVQWIAKLAMCPLVLVSFDAEPDKGDKAAAWWVDVLPNAKRWRPYWGDANAMAQDGVDLRLWVLAGLGNECTSFPRPASTVCTAGVQVETGPNPLLGSEPAPGASVTASQATWSDRHVKIEDLPSFKQGWGLHTVGGEQYDGKSCPAVYFEEK